MQGVLVGAANVTATAVDGLSAAVAAVWPRSMANGEVLRLAADGHAPGEMCEYEFVLSVDPDEADAMLQSARAAGFTLADASRREHGLATVRAAMPLRAFHISWALARLNRIARRHGGFAEMVGPAPRMPSLGVLRDPAPGRELRTDP